MVSAVGGTFSLEWKWLWAPVGNMTGMQAPPPPPSVSAYTGRFWGGRAGPHTPQQTSEGQESRLFMLSQKNDHIA